MLEMIVDKKVLFVLMGIFTGVGVLDKCVVSMTMKRLVQAAGNMSKSTHPLMRLVRSKFEHACMVSDTVENVGVFVDKYLYEYKICGLPLHTAQRVEKICAGLLGVTGLAGAGMTYRVHGMGDAVLRTGTWGIGLGILLWLFHLTTDEVYCMEMAKNYMVDYLENVCLHKYERMNGKELSGRKKVKEDEVGKDIAYAEEVDKKNIGVEEEKETDTQSMPEKSTNSKVPVIKTMRSASTARTSVKEQDADGADAQEIVPGIPKELSKEEMIRQILQEFMA